jgi:Protein of unknown function (DUF3043)
MSMPCDPIGTLTSVTMFRRRPKASEESPEVVAEPEAPTPQANKGRPTPKQRQARGPATPAPKTRKEAVRYQKQRYKAEKAATKAPTTPQARRAAMLAGEEDALPKRDRGPVRQLARDYVDSHRMLSNYMLIIFPFLLLSVFNPAISIVLWLVLLGFVTEWMIVGRRLKAMATSRNMKVTDGAFGLGFYAGSRAYMPRRWRVPRPRVNRGDSI